MFVVVTQASWFYFLLGGLNLLKMSQERFNRYLLFEAGFFGKKTLEHDRQQFFMTFEVASVALVWGKPHGSTLVTGEHTHFDVGVNQNLLEENCS